MLEVKRAGGSHGPPGLGSCRDVTPLTTLVIPCPFPKPGPADVSSCACPLGTEASWAAGRCMRLLGKGHSVKVRPTPVLGGIVCFLIRPTVSLSSVDALGALMSPSLFPENWGPRSCPELAVFSGVAQAATRPAD